MGESAPLCSSLFMLVSFKKPIAPLLHLVFTFLSLAGYISCFRFFLSRPFHHLLFHRHCLYISTQHYYIKSLRWVWNININMNQSYRCTFSCNVKRCSLRVCFSLNSQNTRAQNVPVRPHGWFWGEEMCCYLSSGCWLTLSPAWIQRCRLASAEKYSVCACACAGVCVSYSPEWRSCSCSTASPLPEPAVYIDDSTRFPGATNTS